MVVSGKHDRCFLSVTEPSSMATNDHDERKDRSKNACELISNNFIYDNFSETRKWD